MLRSGVELDSTGLYLSVDSGNGNQRQSRMYFNYLWLRDNCPSSWSPQTRDRVFDISSQPLDIRPTSVRIVGNSLHVVWASDGHVSNYDLDWLKGWASNPSIPDPADVTQKLWYSEHASSLQRFGYSDLLSDQGIREPYLRTLLQEGIALVEGLPDTDDAITGLAEIAGAVRASFSGIYFNVKAEPYPKGVAYTAHALEPHTDSPCEDFPPGVQYLHCRVNTSNGGATTFVDGAAVAEVLRATRRLDFELLAATSVPFRFAHEGIDMRARQRVIERDGAGVVTGVNFSQHMAGIFDLDQRFLDQYYPAFCRFAALLRDPKFVVAHLLKGGECMVFDNHRIVHGRQAYDRTSGSRVLRGCYTDRGEMRSRYRVIGKSAASDVSTSIARSAP